MSKEANVSSRRSAIVVFDFEQVEDLTIIKYLFKVNNKDTRVIPTDVFCFLFVISEEVFACGSNVDLEHVRFCREIVGSLLQVYDNGKRPFIFIFYLRKTRASSFY